jgi:hypothetical protein
MARIAIATAALLLLTGCGSIQHTSEVAQPKGSALRAGPGDTIVTVNQRKSLPNVVGRADIFGRTTPTGMVTVQYLGAQGTKARFVRSSAVIETGATTMNSTTIVIPNYQTTTTRGMVGNVPVYGTSTTAGPPTVIQPRAPQPQAMAQPSITFEIDLAQSKSFVVAGTTVRILSASPTELVYELQ